MNEFLKRIHLTLMVSLLLGTAVALAQTTEKAAGAASASDLNRVSVGSKAPDFTLSDHEDKPVTLSQYRGKKSVVLVFYRGYW